MEKGINLLPTVNAFPANFQDYYLAKTVSETRLYLSADCNLGIQIKTSNEIQERMKESTSNVFLTLI